MRAYHIFLRNFSLKTFFRVKQKGEIMQCHVLTVGTLSAQALTLPTHVSRRSLEIENVKVSCKCLNKIG